MSNMGLELALKQLGIPFARAKVGDRYVLEKLQEKGWRIGAENSGHVILLDKTTTGDGIVASLQVVAAMVRNHMSLHDLCSGMKMFPQLLVNVRFTEGSGNPLENEHVKAVTAEVEAALGNRGRVLLRKSGTEPLIRVMVEGEHEEQVHEFAHRIADAVKAFNLAAKWLKRRRLPPFFKIAFCCFFPQLIQCVEIALAKVIRFG
jgi:phosphoglucosamine mutase